jgi:hypothetical protein
MNERSLCASQPARQVRAKIRDALFAARGQTLETGAAIDAFLDSRLPFSVRGTFGGNTSCVEIIPAVRSTLSATLARGYANSATM